MDEAQQRLLAVGWREWIRLPDLDIRRLKAKIDTGARTSALHAFHIETFSRDNEPWVRFKIHPKQYRTDLHQTCEARIKDERMVSDSGGHKESRYVIETGLELAGMCWPIEITLTARDDMRFRMLLGRTAMNNRLIVNPARSYLTRKPRQLQQDRSK
jgi:hypothetical protein